MPPDDLTTMNARDMTPEQFAAAKRAMIEAERRNAGRADAARDSAAAQRRHPDLSDKKDAR